MELIIISGMSGAGKSHALRAFEDLGYSCVDNVPPELIEKFAEVCAMPDCSINRMVLVVDSRSAELFSKLPSAMDVLKEKKVEFKLLFLDASNEVLLKRYKETRRRHPLLSDANKSLAEAIQTERMKIQLAKNRADIIIDTTHLSGKALTGHIIRLFSAGSNGMNITVMSFGFKYGIPNDADLVFDVRCLPNPFYVEDLRDKFGYNKEVYDYVFKWESAKALRLKLEELFSLLLPLYAEEGKASLVIAFGCTGGQHRSVAFAEYFGGFCKHKNYHTSLIHRDAEK